MKINWRDFINATITIVAHPDYFPKQEPNLVNVKGFLKTIDANEHDDYMVHHERFIQRMKGISMTHPICFTDKITVQGKVVHASQVYVKYIEKVYGRHYDLIMMYSIIYIQESGTSRYFCYKEFTPVFDYITDGLWSFFQNIRVHALEN